MSLRQELTDIQYGRIEDRHGWMMQLDGASSSASLDSAADEV